MRRLSLTVAVLFAAVSTFAAPAKETVLTPFVKGVKRTVLPNGLTLLTRTQPGTGVVAIDTWVKAGYFHEPDEVAGMAHLFEHMFFKGSKKFPGAEQISQELSSVGGITNASTIYNTTNYYFVVPKEGFRRAVEIQADAIANPLFDPAELKKEAEVVIEESNRKYDNPPAVAVERMYATAFTQHRMKRWRIGSNEVLRNIKRENLLDFFETLYRPENLILTIVGDVTHEEALKVARETFGRIPRGKMVKKGGPAEPPQTEFRFGQSSADIRQSYSVFGFHTVGEGHADELALDILGAILGDGRSSRLFRNVVAPDAASTANAGHSVFDEIGILQVVASFDEKNRQEVDRRIIKEIERLKAHGPSEYELQLAKNRTEASFLLGLEQVLQQAMGLAEYEARGSYTEIETRLQKLAALRPEAIRDAARRYLTINNMTLYHYRPKNAPEMTREQALALVTDAAKAAPPALESFPLPAAAPAIRPATADRSAEQIKLPNGATLVVRERRGAPVITTGVFFAGGRVDENSRNAGITQLMTRAMRRGTAKRTGEQIDREIEFLGTQIGSQAQDDYFGFTLAIPRTSYRGGIELLSDVILNPSFPEDGIRDDRFQQLAAIKRNYDSSTTRPQQLANEVFFGNHPYALPADGYPTSVEAIDRAALRSWWENGVVADDALIVVVGDIAADEAKQIISAAFANLPKRKGDRRVTPSPLPPTARMETVEFRDRKQSAIVMAFPTVPPSNPDWPALRLMQNVTSGLAGTFFAELRGKRSLAYTVFAGENPRVRSGVFGAYLASEASKEQEAKTALLAEIRKLQNEGVSPEDVERAKKYYAGSTRIRRQTNSALANDYAWNHFFGVGMEFHDELLEKVNKLTADDLRAVAKKYLAGENFVTAVQRGRS